MIYLAITILWIVFFSSYLVLIFSCTKHFYIPNNYLWKVAFICFIVMAAYVIMASQSWFGTEYEDAFEYVYSGSLLANDVSTRGYWLNPICIDGNINSCLKYASLPHPTGLATLISWFVRVVGPSLEYGSYLSLFFTAISCLNVYLGSIYVGVKRRFSAIATLLFVSCPGVVYLSSTSFAEPVCAGLMSSAVLCSLLITHIYEDDRRESGSLVYRASVVLVLCSSLLLSVFVKRESLLIYSTLLISTIIYSIYTVGKLSISNLWRKNKYICLVILSSLIMISPAIKDSILNFGAVRFSNGPLFSVRNLVEWGPSYARLALSWRFISLFLFSSIGVLYLNSFKRGVFVLLPLIGFIIIFISFGQSFYADFYGEIPLFHFERYTLQIAPLLAIMAAVGVQGLWFSLSGKWISKLRFIEVDFMILAFLVALLASGVFYHNEMAREEIKLRRDPVVSICTRIPQGATLITGQEIMFYLFCDKRLNLISIEMLGRQIPASRLDNLGDGKLFYWDGDESPTQVGGRYPAAASILSQRINMMLERQGGILAPGALISLN